jgi:hypothetical protein
MYIKFSCLAHTRSHKFNIYLQHQNTSIKNISSKLLHLLAGLLLCLHLCLLLLLSGILILPFSVDIPSKSLVILPILQKKTFISQFFMFLGTDVHI